MMNLTRINIVLGVLLAIAAAFAIAMGVDHTQPNVEFLPEMKRSPASAAFSSNAELPDGRTLQPPVVGSIPRGDLPLYFAATKEDAIRAGEEIENPFCAEAAETTGRDEPDPHAELNASIQRGAQIYTIFCVSCHGPTGAGDGPVAKRGFPPPPPLPTGKSVKMKDGQLFHILTYGQGSMSSMAAQLNRSQRWDVINYVRSMQQGADAITAAAAPDQPAPALKTDAPPPATETADEARQ